MHQDSRLILGHPRQLLARWRAHILSIRRSAPLRPIVTIVPSPGAGAHLAERLSAQGATVNVHIMTLDQWAWRCAPEGTTPLPPAAESVLARLVPDDLVDVFRPKPPDIREALVNAAWTLRREGVTSDELARRGVPWAPIMAWLNDMLGQAAAIASAWDTSRVYQYAGENGNDGSEHDPVFMLYGLTEAHADQWGLLKHLARGSLTILTPWPAHVLANRAAWRYLAPWVAVWRRLGVGMEAMPVTGEVMGTVRRIGADSEMGQIQAVLQIVQHHLGDGTLAAEPPLLVGGDPAVRTSLAAAGRRVGLDMWMPAARDDAFWRTFLSVAHDEAPRPETLFWLEDRGVACDPGLRTALYRRPGGWRMRLGGDAGAARELNWARQWAHHLAAAKTWRQVGALVAEAAARQPGRVSAERVAAAQSWRIFDAWELPPDPPLVRQLLARPSADSGEDDTPPVAGARVVIALPESAAPSRNLLLERAGLAREAWRRARTAYRRMVLSHPGPGDTVWLVDRGSAKPEAEAIMSALPQLPVDEGPGDGARAWYRHWRDVDAYSRWTGQVTGPSFRLTSEELSPSALETFGACPYRFFWRQALGVLSPDADEEAAEVSPALLGRWAHQALQLLAEQPRTALARDEIAAAVARAIRQFPVPDPVPPSLVRAAEHKLASELSEAVWRETLWTSRPEMSWAELGLQWELDTGVSVWRLSGRLDRLDRGHDGRWLLVDYKTGELPDPNRVEPAVLQLALYHLGTAAVFGLDPDQLDAVLMGISQKSGFRVRRLGPDSPARNRRVYEILDGMAQRMALGQFFPAPHPQRDVCRSCSLAAICPAEVASYAKRLAAAAPAYRELWDGTRDEEVDL
ncbi:MAG: PD-(D/E)XK nuclease family protein [Thermaerobacter sp.]|nr:PD-(D/E)XK nuclease family protein [Thermaerobacter sp.]